MCRMGKCQSVLELEMVSFQPKVMHKAESLSKNNVTGERIASKDKKRNKITQTEAYLFSPSESTQGTAFYRSKTSGTP